MLCLQSPETLERSARGRQAESVPGFISLLKTIFISKRSFYWVICFIFFECVLAVVKQFVTCIEKCYGDHVCVIQGWSGYVMHLISRTVRWSLSPGRGQETLLLLQVTSERQSHVSFQTLGQNTRTLLSHTKEQNLSFDT